MFPHLVKHVQGIHFHTAHGLRDLLRGHIHDAHIAYMGLLHDGITADQKRHHQHQQQHRCHDEQYQIPHFSGFSIILHIRLYHSLLNSAAKILIYF